MDLKAHSGKEDPDRDREAPSVTFSKSSRNSLEVAEVVALREVMAEQEEASPVLRERT